MGAHRVTESSIMPRHRPTRAMAGLVSPRLVRVRTVARLTENSGTRYTFSAQQYKWSFPREGPGPANGATAVDGTGLGHRAKPECRAKWIGHGTLGATNDCEETC